MASARNEIFRVAPIAYQHMHATRKVRFLMQNGLATVLVALFTKLMGWLAAFHWFLQRVGEDAGCNLVQLIALLLSLPVFHLHNLLFQFAYALNVRKAARLRRHCLRLGIQYRGLQLDSVAVNLGSVPQLQDCLNGLANRLKTGGYGLERR
jgi:hypothetical protein